MTIQKRVKLTITHWGDFSVIADEDEKKDEEHLLLYMGSLLMTCFYAYIHSALQVYLI